MTENQFFYIVREVMQDIACTEERAGTIDTKLRTCVGMTAEVYRELQTAAAAHSMKFLGESNFKCEYVAGYPIKSLDPGRMAPGIWVMREIEIPFDITGENATDCDDDCEHCEYATCPKEEVDE